MSTFYNAALSQIHDQYYGDIAWNAAHEILRHTTNRPPENKRLIDLGCGSGIVAEVLCHAEFDVIGVDISPEMLAIAQKRAPNAKFICTSLFDYTLPKADVICAIGESINYLVGASSENRSITDFFDRIYSSLTSDGLFVFDFLTPQVDRSKPCRMFEQTDTTLFVETTVSDITQILERRITFFVQKGNPNENQYEKHYEIHRQQLFEPRFLQSLLEKIGFHIIEIHAYNDVDFRQGHIAFVCTK